MISKVIVYLYYQLTIKKMATKTTLQTICNKYCNINHNEDNYSIGGGLTDGRFASNRHEDAKYDEGKLTLGEATQLFKKATGLSTDEVKEVIEFAVPNMEWHHAGKLPKQYGGGMKKTYFLNAKEICKVASNWTTYVAELEADKIAKKEEQEAKKDLQAKRNEFLQANAKKVERVATKPAHFYCLYSECNGKYGWFDASKNIYNMAEYHTGWVFESQELYNEFLNIN